MKKLLIFLFIIIIQSSSYANVTGFTLSPKSGEVTDMSVIAGESMQKQPTDKQKLEDRIALASKGRYR